MQRLKTRTPTNWTSLLLIVTTVFLGTQLLRANLAYFRWLFGDRYEWSSLQLGGLALGIYSLVILVGPLLRRMNSQSLLLRSAAVVGAARLLAQLWWGDPLVDAIAVFIGVIAYLIFLPVALSWLVGDRIHQPEAGWHFALLLLSGLALDGALHSLFLTYDPIWQTTWAAIGIGLLTVAGQWGLVWMLSRRPGVPLPYREPSLRNALPLLMFGPFFVYYLLVGGNLARLNSFTSWPLPLNAFWFVAGLFVAVLVAWLLPPGRAVGLVGLVGLLATVNPSPLAGNSVILYLWISQVSAGLLITSGCTHLARNRNRTSVGSTAWLWWASMLFLILLIFLYYVTYDLSLPITRGFVLYLAAVLMGASTLAVIDRWAVSLRIRPALDHLGVPSLHSLALILAVSLALTTAVWQRPATVRAQSNAVTIFNYNIHNGFNTRGHLDLEAMAQLLAAQRADVITLQEVSRGWVVNGSVDMAVWLSWRLGMPVTFSSTSGLDWGHALLSSYPVIRHDEFALPPPGLPLTRGFAYHEIDVGDDSPLLVINTHLHHLRADHPIREQQIATILHFLEGSPLRRLILTGDLNAKPDEPTLLRLYATGLRDLLDEAGMDPGYTFPADSPAQRIDYILASPDVGLSELSIPPDVLSDHLGIRATITLP